MTRDMRGSVLAGSLVIACGGGGSGEADSGFTSDGGEVTGAETTAAGSEGADESGDDGAPTQCADEELEANEADPIPGCGGAAVGPAPTVLQAGGVVGVPGAVTTTDPVLVGAWTPLIESNGHLAIHSIHRPTGKFLQFGGHDGEEPDCDAQADCDKIVWYPPAPCSPFVVGHENCEVEFDADPVATGVQQHFGVAQPTELFCSGHVNLPPGNPGEQIEPLVLTAGGHLSGDNGINAALAFSESLPDDMAPQPGDWTWTDLEDFSQRRWYPTSTGLADGRASVLGGSTVNDIMCEQGNGFGLSCTCDPNAVCDDLDEEPCEDNLVHGVVLCNPGCTINDVAACTEVAQYNDTVEILERDAQGEFFWDRYEQALMGKFLLYPFMFVLPDLEHYETSWKLGGKLIYVGREGAAQNDMAAWIYDDTTGTPTITPIGGESCIGGSSAVMLRPGKFMKFGGGGTANRMTEVLDLTDPQDEDPQWRRVGPTGVARRFSTGLLLPDGTALATGGTMSGNQGDYDLDDDDPGAIDGGDERHLTVFTTELFDPDPAVEAWCRLADVPAEPEADPPLPALRGYHSQSFLLPDGRVYLGASGRSSDGADHYNYQLFSPPYLFKGERPQVDFGQSLVPTVMTGATLELERTGAVPISRVTLVKLSSSTHNWDMEQRFLELDDVTVGVDTVTAAMPTSTCHATPGPYMVFAISDEGVPSIGQYLYVDGSCAAATETSEPPVAEFVPMMVNMGGTNTLKASCSSAATVLELQDFGRSVDELCQALGGCPTTGTVDLTARLVASDTQSVPTGGITLDTGVVTFSGGHSTMTEPLRLDAKSGSWSAAVDLGSGNHTLELCASVAGIGACMAQPLAIGALAGTQSNAYGYRLGTIESRFEPIAGLPFTRRLILTDNGTAKVALPGGFRFPYFGTNYTTIYVGANGGIRFTSGTIAATNATLPSTASTAPHVAPWWDDLNPAAGGQVLWRHMGKKVIVSWENVPHKLGPASGRVSFQVHLWDDGRIEMHYDDVTAGLAGLDNGGSATIGMQRPGGTNSLVLSTNSPSWLASGARAAAYDRRGCIAADLRAIDSMPCEVVLDASAALVIKACSSAPQALNVPVPKLATTCRVDEDAYVHGEVVSTSVRKPVVAGRVTLSPGNYTLRWWVHGDHRGAERTRLFGPIAGSFEQSLTVQSDCPTLLPAAASEVAAEEIGDSP